MFAEVKSLCMKAAGTFFSSLKETKQSTVLAENSQEEGKSVLSFVLDYEGRHTAKSQSIFLIVESKTDTSCC